MPGVRCGARTVRRDDGERADLRPLLAVALAVPLESLVLDRRAREVGVLPRELHGGRAPERARRARRWRRARHVTRRRPCSRGAARLVLRRHGEPALVAKRATISSARRAARTTRGPRRARAGSRPCPARGVAAQRRAHDREAKNVPLASGSKRELVHRARALVRVLLALLVRVQPRLGALARAEQRALERLLHAPRKAAHDVDLVVNDILAERLVLQYLDLRRDRSGRVLARERDALAERAADFLSGRRPLAGLGAAGRRRRAAVVADARAAERHRAPSLKKLFVLCFAFFAASASASGVGARHAVRRAVRRAVALRLRRSLGAGRDLRLLRCGRRAPPPEGREAPSRR